MDNFRVETSSYYVYGLHLKFEQSMISTYFGMSVPCHKSTKVELLVILHLQIAVLVSE